MKINSLKLLSIILIIIILLTGCKKDETSSQISDNSLEQLDENKLLREYLKHNYSAIDISNDNEFDDLNIMDSDVEDKEIFFTAEIHGVKANEELNMKFLKYFKEKADFKYLLCENSYSNAYFIKKYLDTGDIKILEEIYKPLKGTFAWNKEGYNFWKELYEYNSSLPEGKTIHPIGVDIEHQPVNAYRFLVEVLPEKEIPIEIIEKIDKVKETFKDMKTYSSLRTLEYEQCSRELQKDMEDKKNIYQEYLGENFIGFKLVNTNVLNAIEAYKHNGDQVDWNNVRDRMIYENFQVIQEELPEGKYYGQWGLNHTFQTKEKDMMWFAAYLNGEDSKFKNKVLTIVYNYDDCEQMTKTRNGKYGTDKISIIFPEIKEANDLIGGDLNIYKLNGEDSLFSHIQMYYTLTGEKLEENILDFFQYIVYIRNSKATRPLEG